MRAPFWSFCGTGSGPMRDNTVMSRAVFPLVAVSGKHPALPPGQSSPLEGLSVPLDHFQVHAQILQAVRCSPCPWQVV